MKEASNAKLAETVEQPTPKRHWIPNPTGRNRWTKAKEAKDKGLISEETYDDKVKEAQGRQLTTLLVNHATGKVKLKATQVKAAEIVLDRREPRLSSVEQTVTSPDEGKSPLELLKELAPLLKQHPEWLRTLGFVPLEPSLALNPSITGVNSAKTDANQAVPESVITPVLEPQVDLEDARSEGETPDSSTIDAPKAVQQ